MQTAVTGIANAMACCLFVPFFGFWLTLLCFYLKFHWEDAPAALHKWAGEHGHRLREASVRWFLRGPFFFTIGKWQAVFRVTVETPKGQTKRGWVRVGENWWPNADRIEVVWDPERPEPAPNPSSEHPPMWDPDLDTQGS